MAGMMINHNVSAMNTLRNLNGSNGALSKSLQKLSSGYKINVAADDPSGLIISEQLRSQISGMERAIRNTQEASNVLSIAEGALIEMNEMLKTMRGLALHAANSGVTALDQISADQSEVDSAIQTIDRIANTTKYSDQYLLNGSKGLIYSTRSLSGNKLVDTGLTRLDQVFKREGTVIGLSYTGMSSTVGQAVMTNQAERAFLEADAGTTGDVIDATTGMLTQDQEFIITGALGARQFSFSMGTDVSQVVAALGNVEASTGVGAALTIGSQGVTTLQSTANIFTSSNSWDLYGMKTGVNTAADGQLYVNAEYKSATEVEIHLYTSAIYAPSSEVATVTIDPTSTTSKGVLQEVNDSGLSGSVDINGDLINAAGLGVGYVEDFSISPAGMINGTQMLTNQYQQGAVNDVTTSASWAGVTGLQDNTSYYVLTATEATALPGTPPIAGTAGPGFRMGIYSDAGCTQLVAAATSVAANGTAAITEYNSSGIGGSITFGACANVTGVAAANATVLRTEEVSIASNPLLISNPATQTVVDSSLFANLKGLENHLGTNGTLQVLTVAAPATLTGGVPAGTAPNMNVAIYSGAPAPETLIGYVSTAPGSEGTFIPNAALGITDVSGTVYLRPNSNPVYSHTGDVSANAATFLYNSPTAGVINEENDGANVVKNWTLNGVELNKNTDAEGRMHVKVVDEGSNVFHVEVYKDADMTQLVAKSASGTEGQSVVLSEQNSSGLAGSIVIGDDPAATDTITLRPQLGIRMYSSDYGSREYIRIQANKGSMWEMYNKTTDVYERIDATINPITEQVNGQNAIVSINGTALSVSGLTAEVSTSVFSGNIQFENGILGQTSIAQVGYDEGNVSSRIGAMFNNTNLMVNAGTNNAENIENIRNGMQYQLAENDGDQARTVYGIPSMAVPNIGQIEVDGVTYTLQDVLGGGKASLSNEPILAMKVISKAIDDVSSLRARIGAFQSNMLQTNENALNVAVENITLTESALRDADMAAESTDFTKNQILVQAGTAMLAQANVVSQNVLKLLG